MKLLFTLIISCCFLSSYAQRGRVFHSFQEAFEEPDSVFQLDLSASGLKELPKAVSLLPNLEVLILTENFIETFPRFLCDMKKLRHLDMGHNYLVSIPEEIANLENLKFLSLSWNYTLDESWINISSLNGLMELKLDGLKLKQLPNQIKGLSSLQHLDLSYNLLDCLPKSIYKISEIKRIGLGHNRFSQKELQKIQSNFKRNKSNEVEMFY